MTRLKYTISQQFRNSKEVVDRFLDEYSRSNDRQRSVIRYLVWMGKNHEELYFSQQHAGSQGGYCREHMNRLLKKWCALGWIGYQRGYKQKTCDYYVVTEILNLDLDDPATFRRTPMDKQKLAVPLEDHTKCHTSNSNSQIPRNRNVGVSDLGLLGRWGGRLDYLGLEKFGMNDRDNLQILRFSDQIIGKAIEDTIWFMKTRELTRPVVAMLTERCKYYEKKLQNERRSS